MTDNDQPVFEPSPWLLQQMIDRAMSAFDADREQHQLAQAQSAERSE